MMLTDDELNAMRRAAKDDPRVVDTFWHLLYARAIIAAYQAKLLAGVEMPPDPFVQYEGCKPMYTADQLQQYGDARDHAGYIRGVEDAKQCNEADELLRNLHLEPERYRTEGGAINHLKVRAAILNPRDYCDHEWKTAPASLGGELCSKCGRMK